MKTKYKKKFSSVAQSCLTLCNPMDCSTPGFPVHHELLELTQTHVHWVTDAIQPSPPLSSPSSALNLSQHHGLFQGVNSSNQVAKGSVLPMNIQGWFPLGFTGLISLLSKGLSSIFRSILHYIPIIYLHISPLQQCFSSIALFIFEFQAIKMCFIHKSPLNAWWLNYSVLKSILYVKHLQNKTLNI